jgi:hypothetical protein
MKNELELAEERVREREYMWPCNERWNEEGESRDAGLGEPLPTALVDQSIHPTHAVDTRSVHNPRCVPPKTERNELAFTSIHGYSWYARKVE